MPDGRLQAVSEAFTVGKFVVLKELSQMNSDPDIIVVPGTCFGLCKAVHHFLCNLKTGSFMQHLHECSSSHSKT